MLRRWGVAHLLAADVLGHGAAFGDHLIEPAIETRQRIGDAIRRVRVGAAVRCEKRSENGRRILRGRRRRTVHDRRNRHWLLRRVLDRPRSGLRHVPGLRCVLDRLWRRLLRLRRGLRRRRGLPDASSRHALELPGQVIETIVYGREAIIDVLVLDTVTV